MAIKINFDDDTLDAPSNAPDLHISDAAAARICAIMAKKNDNTLFLRVSIKGGGCNGFSYSFNFDKTRHPSDIEIKHNGALVLIDVASYNMVKGSTIDFEENVMASQFVVKNPNAKSSCGCGNSFSL